jgi:transcriptional regulator with XRE-family HTH domain
MDPVGARLLQRIQGLLATRPDLKDRTIFGRRIGRPTPSWLSEFLNGKRTTNDLRLVLKIAKVFGVSVGYLLGESEPERERGRRDAAGDLRRDQRARSGAFAFLRSVITGCQRRRIWHRRRRFPRGRREYHRIKRIASEAETPVGTGTDAERRIERRLPLLDSVPMKPCKPSATITVALSFRQ